MRVLGVIAGVIDRINEWTGRGAAWLALLLVVTQFVVVVMRYVFGVGSVFLQESLLYLHSGLFLVAGGYTLLHNGHVRVDVFYRDASPKTKTWIDLFGSLFFLLPVCAVIWITGWPYVSASWAIREGSRETSGIQAIFLLKTLILVFAALVALQGLSMMLHAVLRLMGKEIPPEEIPEEGV